MRPPHRILDRNQVYRLAAEHLQAHLKFKDYKRKTSAQVLWSLRFGIESSYRQMHEVRIRTSTRRPVLRLLYVGIALVLRNLWVWLHYTILSMPRRGGRAILLERLRWETLLLWLLHVVEDAFGVADVTYTERDVEYELAM